MIKCSEDCITVCDYCKTYNFNGEPVTGLSGQVAMVYVGKGKCMHPDHTGPREPYEFCRDFHCKRAKEAKPDGDQG